MEKECTKCKEIKDIKEFSWKIKAKNLKQPWCKSCKSEYDRLYYGINRDELLKYNKQYQKNNLEKFRKSNKRYRERHLEKYRETCRLASAKYRRNNPQKSRERTKLWMRECRKNNPDKIKEWSKRYNNTHVEEIKKRVKKYRKDNPGKILAKNALRRARKVQATPIDANKELIRFYYKIALTMKDYEVDHIMPLAKGGLHHENNLQLLPSKLNLEKSSKWPLTKEEQKKYTGFSL